jgi:outer membrane protein assembly factor BamB
MTAPDFQTQLRLQLREAARKEERRSRLALPAGWLRGLSPALAAAAVALLVLAAVLAGLALRGPNPSREAAPKAVDRFSRSSSLGPVISAYGSVWAVDPTGSLLRLDPVSHDVLGSTDIPTRSGLAAGGGSLWVGSLLVGQLNALTRIDPKTGRATQVPLRTPSGDEFALLQLEFAGGYAWGVGPDGLLRIDLRRNVADRFVPLESGGLVRGTAVQDGWLWFIARDDRLLRLDPRTGARRGSVRVTWSRNASVGAEAGVALTATKLDGRIARVDLPTGRELWVRDLGGLIGWWTVSGNSVWAHVTTGHGRDHVVRLDARTGRVLATVQLPDLGVTTMTAPRPGELWVGTPGGPIDVVRAAPR